MQSMGNDYSARVNIEQDYIEMFYTSYSNAIRIMRQTVMQAPEFKEERQIPLLTGISLPLLSSWNQTFVHYTRISLGCLAPRHPFRPLTSDRTIAFLYAVAMVVASISFWPDNGPGDSQEQAQANHQQAHPTCEPILQGDD